MESTFLSVKFVIFMGLMIIVVAMLAAVLVAAVYQVVRDKVQESRRRDEVTLEPSPATLPIDNRRR